VRLLVLQFKYGRLLERFKFRDGRSVQSRPLEAVVSGDPLEAFSPLLLRCCSGCGPLLLPPNASEKTRFER
jgi:hypothetical protein